MKQSLSQFKSNFCKKQHYCVACRYSKKVRKEMLEIYDLPKVNFECFLKREIPITEEERKAIEEAEFASQIIDKLDLKTLNNYPPLYVQAFNLLQALTRVGKSIVKKEVITVNDEEKQRRLELCKKCDKFEPEAAKGRGRCKICGCVGAWKSRLSTEHCPAPFPKW